MFLFSLLNAIPIVILLPIVVIRIDHIMHGKWSQIKKKIGSDNEFDTIGSFDRIHLDPKRL